MLSDRMGCRKTNEARLHSLCWGPHGQSPPISGIMKTKQSNAHWLSVQISYTKPMTTNYIFHIQQLLEKTGHTKTQTQETQFLQTSLCLSPPPLLGIGGGRGQTQYHGFTEIRTLTVLLQIC